MNKVIDYLWLKPSHLMKESTKNNFLLPLVVVVIGSFVISPIANALYDPTKKTIPFITPLLKFFSFIWNDFLNYKASVWIELIILIAMFICNWIYWQTRPVYLNNQPGEWPNQVKLEPTANFANYTEDKFKTWKWKWRYNFFPDQKRYTIEDLKPVCGKCNIKMLQDGFSELTFHCPNCSQIYDAHYKTDENPVKIEALINHKIENNLF